MRLARLNTPPEYFDLRPDGSLLPVQDGSEINGWLGLFPRGKLVAVYSQELSDGKPAWDTSTILRIGNIEFDLLKKSVKTSMLNMGIFRRFAIFDGVHKFSIKYFTSIAHIFGDSMSEDIQDIFIFAHARSINTHKKVI